MCRLRKSPQAFDDFQSNDVVCCCLDQFLENLVSASVLFEQNAHPFRGAFPVRKPGLEDTGFDFSGAFHAGIVRFSVVPLKAGCLCGR
jgi:hypothetical protein